MDARPARRAPRHRRRARGRGRDGGRARGRRVRARGARSSTAARPPRPGPPSSCWPSPSCAHPGCGRRGPTSGSSRERPGGGRRPHVGRPRADAALPRLARRADVPGRAVSSSSTTARATGRSRRSPPPIPTWSSSRCPRTAASPAASTPGVEAALRGGAEHVFLLNNDATVEPGALEPLVGAAAAASVGAACSQILHEGSGTIWYAGADVRPAARAPGAAHGLRAPGAAAGDGAVPDRARLRRRDARPARRARPGRPPRRRALRLRGGRRLVAPRPAGRALGSSSSPRASSTIASPPPRAAPRRRPPSTTRSGTASSSPSGTHRSAGSARCAAAPRPVAAFCVQALRSGSRRAGLRAVVDGLRDASSGRLGPRGA